MLEMLLMQYEDTFGEPFPLKKYEGHREIELINLLFHCCNYGIPCSEVNEKELPNMFPDAPHRA